MKAVKLNLKQNKRYGSLWIETKTHNKNNKKTPKTDHVIPQLSWLDHIVDVC